MTVVKNTNKKSKAENAEYVHATTIIEGKCIDILLTGFEAKRAIRRALKNPEDIPSEGCCLCGKDRVWSASETKEDRCSFWNRVLGNCKDDAR